MFRAGNTELAWSVGITIELAPCRHFTRGESLAARIIAFAALWGSRSKWYTGRLKSHSSMVVFDGNERIKSAAILLCDVYSKYQTIYLGLPDPCLSSTWSMIFLLMRRLWNIAHICSVKIVCVISFRLNFNLLFARSGTSEWNSHEMTTIRMQH